MKEIDLLKEAQKESSRIGAVMGEVSAREERYNEKLAGLRKQLPNILARMALGEGVTRAEVDDVKQSILLLKEQIDEIPIALEGLEPWHLRAQHQIGKAVRQIEKTYQSTKDKLSEGDESPGLTEQLKSYGAYIGMSEDAEEFCLSLKKQKPYKH